MNAPSSTASPANSAIPRASRWRTALKVLAGIAVLLLVVVLAGPRNQFGSETPTPRTAPPADPAQLDAWLQQGEKAFADMKPSNAKGITWATKPGERTPWAIVYLHGFSASRLETAPLADVLAQALGANVFHARLTGHGLASVEAMGQASVQDWLADTVEAIQIGKTLGDKVLVLGVSTGATLATWAATTPLAKDIAAMAFVSPNFGPKDKRADMVNGPWGMQIALAMEGPVRGWTPENAAEANAWSTKHATRAVFPMMALVKHVRESKLETVKTPVLMLYSEKDEVVDPQETKTAFARIGSPVKSLQAVDYSTSASQHVLASGIKAPTAVAPMADTMARWVKSLP
ncbi:YqiA/YcfP family alpha/beta fold hydrolase [Curvibacter sp. APW13]|uniref:alpha/beta hydrolase n=1 Tax=Curvibacter sp. APW13 TaxID=3077236 RepID=UPI0028DFE654|nr:alpha/beta fold hydrolase [Curvibacter sp. APW13]MDT8991476.1 YqiA/YcfP family alpha/beta fold hydrolase [Curvibacter sp. APW13]